MDLTSDDVQDILNLLDGLPYGEMHLQTTWFSLWLRRTPDGEWTQEVQVRSEPMMIPADAETAAETGAAVVAREVPLPDKGSFVDDFRDYLDHICAFFTTQLSRPAIAGLLAEAQCDADLAVAFKERLLMQRRTVLHTILQRAVARGELRAEIDLDVIMDMVHGAIWYRTLLLKAPLRLPGR